MTNVLNKEFVRDKMKFKFSRIEVKELLYATVMLSVAFSILFGGFSVNALLFLPMMFLVMIFSFVIHELSHKFMAQKYKYHAEFRANKGMLWISVALSFFGFIIAAPGAVHFFGQHDPKKTGIIAYAGPFSNLVIAIICFGTGILFLGLPFLTKFSILYLVYFINAVLAVFNMLPLPRFDGAKIWAWNKTIFIITGIVALFLYSIPMMIA